MDKSGKPNTGAKVVRCTCKDAGQDAIHGEGKRVANGCKGGWRCTVCKQVHE